MPGLRAFLMRHVPSDDGSQADVLFVESNGAEHQIRCLCRTNGLTELGDHVTGGVSLKYLREQYGDQVLAALGEQVALRQYRA